MEISHLSAMPTGEHTYLHVYGRRKAVCVNGHARTPENVNAQGACRACSREASRRHYWSTRSATSV